MREDIKAAVLTILSTLPEEAEFRFYWKDGAQHMSFKVGEEPAQVARLNRAPNGTGVVVPASMH